MTSAQSMQGIDDRYKVRKPSPALLVIVLLTMLTGCGQRLTDPVILEAPYLRDQLWGVVPPVNESGATVVDTAAVADALAQEAQEVRGIDTIPVNRVIRTMRQLGLDAVTSHGDALTLMNVLKLDGLAVASVTAYDPYRPLRLGMAVQLYSRPQDEAYGLDPRDLTRSTGAKAALGELGPPRPVAQAAGVFDASNHQTLKWLRDYAKGRNEPASAYGEDVYLVSMELYTHFVCYRLLHDLLEQERVRLTPVAKKTR